MVKKSIHNNLHCDTNEYLFTSESVTMGHPDKVADHISDAILDAMLAQDPKSRVACETLVTTGLVVVAGEITTKAYVDIPGVIRKTVKKIGYDDPAIGFDGDDCAVIVSIDNQSADISQNRPAQGTGSRRPGANVRICLQGNTGAYADADSARTRYNKSIGKNQTNSKNPLAATGRQKSGNGRIRKQQAKTHSHSRRRNSARAVRNLQTTAKTNHRKSCPARSPQTPR